MTPEMAQVLASPDDLHARRRRADALVAASDPHGDYLRLACRLDETGFDDPERPELERRVGRLEREHFQEWSAQVRAIGPFGEHRLPYLRRLAFDRGLVEHLGGTGREIAAHLSAAAAVAPIRSIRVRPEENEQVPTELAGCAALAQVRRVNISALARWHGPWALRLLEACRPLERLSVTGLFGRELQHVMSLPALDRLEWLTLLDNAPPGGAATVEHLATLQGVPVRRLELCNVRLGPGALGELTGHASLRALVLDHVDGQRAGLDLLLAADEGPNLEELVLRDLGVDLPEAFLRSPSLRGLRRLVCSVLSLDDVVDLLPEGLRELELAPTLWTVDGLRRLASEEGLGQLRHLRLVSPRPLTREEAQALAQARLPALRSLTLGCVDEGAVEVLAGSPLFAGLEVLTLAAPDFAEPTPITGAMVNRLAATPHLRELKVSGYPLAPEALQRLLSEEWRTLETLSVEARRAVPEAEPLGGSVGGPVLEEVTLECAESSLHELLRSPLATRLRALTLDCPIDASHAEALCGLPRLVELCCHGPVQAAARHPLWSRFGPQLTLRTPLRPVPR